MGGGKPQLASKFSTLGWCNRGKEEERLVERFLMDGFQPQQLSTYALTLYKHTATVDGKTVLVGSQSCVHVADFWDTAGQERFQSMHASYYHKAHACIMV
ncbi:Rab-like protein 2A, partial [Eschrichtius robustus]|nr:Rab-like protein 2A [Eschrichtius robustus]